MLKTVAWVTALIMLSPVCSAETLRTGQSIMEESFQRHEMFPYVLEKQSMILTDAAGHSTVRRLNRYSRIEQNGSVRFLLRFEAPEVVKKVALLATRSASGRESSTVYLPAFGKEMKSTGTGNRNGRFLDTDFAVGDLLPEILTDFIYERRPDQSLDKVHYFIVDASPKNRAVEAATGYSKIRHYIRQDNYFIFQSRFMNLLGQWVKQRSNHDLKQVHGNMWRANMILMENYDTGHKTLIKVNKRIFSRDDVPAEMFTPAWLMKDDQVVILEDELQP